MRLARLALTFSFLTGMLVTMPSQGQPPSARPAYIFLCEHPSYEDKAAYRRLSLDSVERYLARGEGYHRRAQYARAAAEFKNGLKLAPEDARLYYHLGLAHFSPREHQQAVFYFRKALQLRPGMYMAKGYLGLSLGYLGKGKDSAAELAATMRVPPATAEQWKYLASMHFFRRDYKGSIEIANRGIARFPRSGPYMARGRSYAALGQNREAAADFTTLIAHEPGSAWAWGYRAEAYEKLGRKGEALSDRREFQRLSREVLP